MAGSPLKNVRNRLVREAILRGLSEGKDPADFLVPFTDRLKEMALAGDIAALRELFDRIDGRPAQAITGERDGEPIVLRIASQDADA